jgi:hypothetical protein
MQVAGASTLQLSGSAQASRIAAGGASRLKLGEFPLKQCQIDLEGHSSALLTVQSDSSFQARLVGASTLRGSIQAKDIELKLDGASHAAFDGKANDANIKASGASSFKLPGTVVQTADVKLSGASSGTIETRVKLKYDLTSTSSLRYLGDPATVEGTKSGFSSISRQR